MPYYIVDNPVTKEKYQFDFPDKLSQAIITFCAFANEHWYVPKEIKPTERGYFWIHDGAVHSAIKEGSVYKIRPEENLQILTDPQRITLWQISTLLQSK